jgi:2-polyprenyl-3-methyl-5-hydroxy-6-metoxy-1,4-benzoquinol methylase
MTDAAKVRDGYVEWKGWSEDAFGKVDRHASRYYTWHVERAVGRPAALSVLEIGFGNGAFLGWCRKRGWDVAGIELDPRLRAAAQRAGFAAHADMAELPADQRFGLVAMFDVLEHIEVEEVVSFMRGLAQRLVPDGAILLRVPNGDSPFGGRHQHGDLTHVVAYGEFKLKQLAQLAGLKVVALGEAPWHAQQTEGRSLRCLLRATTRSLLNRLIGFAYFGGTVDLTTNLAAVLVPALSPRKEIQP